MSVTYYNHGNFYHTVDCNYGVDEVIKFEGHDYYLREDGLYEVHEPEFIIAPLIWSADHGFEGWFLLGPYYDMNHLFPIIIGKGQDLWDVALEITNSNDGWQMFI